MMKDIPILKVKDIAVAAVQESERNEETGAIWRVYLINLKKVAVENVLVTSRGYGLMDGEETETSVLRYSIKNLPAGSFVVLESILENVFGLNNEYWVTFYQNSDMYDKKFIFLPETISEENLVSIPLIGKKGVMIK